MSGRGQCHKPVPEERTSFSSDGWVLDDRPADKRADTDIYYGFVLSARDYRPARSAEKGNTVERTKSEHSPPHRACKGYANLYLPVYFHLLTSMIVQKTA
jgi:hypothetical protein